MTAQTNTSKNLIQLTLDPADFTQEWFVESEHLLYRIKAIAPLKQHDPTGSDIGITFPDAHLCLLPILTVPAVDIH